MPEIDDEDDWENDEEVKPELDQEKLMQAGDDHARMLVARGLPASLPRILEEWLAASEAEGEQMERVARLAGRTEMPESFQRARAAIEAARRSGLAYVENAMVQARAEATEAARQAEVAALRTYISQQPALQKLYDFLFAKYVEGLAAVAAGGMEKLDQWLREQLRIGLGIGAIGAAIIWRKRKTFMTFPITATPEQKWAALWEWVDYILSQIYQVKNKVTVVGSTTTPEDQVLLRRMTLLARTDAVTVSRSKRA